MGIHAWASHRTLLCEAADCPVSSYNSLPDRGWRSSGLCWRNPGSLRGLLAGYCVLIWAQPVRIDGSFVGTAVSDHDMFRFFSADVRLDELDGLGWPSLLELRSQITIARFLILARLSQEQLTA